MKLLLNVNELFFKGENAARHEQSSLSKNPLGDFTLENEEMKVGEFMPWVLCIESSSREGALLISHAQS